MLAVIGEALVDLVDAGDHRTFTAHPGGSPLNVAVGLARLGAPTALLARLATDAFGRLVREHARSNGVGLDAATTAREPTTLAVASLDDQRRASYDFYVDGTADWQWTTTELAALPADTTVLHTGSLASWTSPGDAAISQLVAEERARGRALISYDPNVRPQLLGTPERGRPRIERFVAQAHVVKASDEDIAWLYPGRAADEVAGRWLAAGTTLVVITRGPDGASAYRAARARIDEPAPPTDLVDTVGAGDALMSGLLASLVDLAGVGARPLIDGKALDAVSDEVLRAVLRRSVLAAAMTCERAGAQPPTAAELAAREAQ